VAERGPDLLDLARRVAGWAREGEQVEAYVAAAREVEVKAYGGEVESLSSAASAGAGVRVVTGHRQGFAYAGALDEEILHDALEEARDNAGFATRDEHVGLAEPDGVDAAPLELWRDELEGVPAARKVELALDLERRVRARDRRVRGVRTAEYSDAQVEAAVATTTGIAVASRRTSCSLSALALAEEAGETQTGYGWSLGRGVGDLDPERAAEGAVDRATRMLGARKPRSARVTVVLDPRVTATFLAVIGGTLSGEAVLKGRSLFADRVGEQVGVPALTLAEDPTQSEAYLASTHDGEGLACRRTLLLDGGVLRGFLWDSYAARRAGARPTGSAVRGGFKGTPHVGSRALALTPGARSPRDVLALVGDGLFVQGVSGVHSGVNVVSGDFSVGAEGLMVRGGELAEPVREITIASTLQRMLQHVVAVGDDVEWLPSSAAGMTLAIADVSLGGA
jgi:PmbA protein